MSDNSYRVMIRIKGKGPFKGTGINERGHITAEEKVNNQCFYSKKEADKLSVLLTNSGFESKVI